MINRKRAWSRPALIAGSLLVAAFAVVALAASVIAPPEDPESPYLMRSHGLGRAPESPSC